MRHCREHQLHRPEAGGNTRNGVAENRKQVPDLAGAAARQDQNQRWIGTAAPRLVGIRAAARQVVRSADDRRRCRAGRRGVDAWPARTAGSQARNRHSRAWRERARAATPKLTATRSRGSAIEGARARTRRATRWVKSGLSMMTSASGRAAMMRVGGLADAAQDRRQPARDRGKTDNRKVVDGKRARNSRRRHGSPADAFEFEHSVFTRAAARAPRKRPARRRILRQRPGRATAVAAAGACFIAAFPRSRRPGKSWHGRRRR